MAAGEISPGLIPLASCKLCGTDPHREPQRMKFLAYCHHKGCPLYMVRLNREDWTRLHAIDSGKASP